MNCWSISGFSPLFSVLTSCYLTLGTNIYLKLHKFSTKNDFDTFAKIAVVDVTNWSILWLGMCTFTEESSSFVRSFLVNISEIFSQCGKLRIFLPYRFYVKSNLAILQPQCLDKGSKGNAALGLHAVGVEAFSLLDKRTTCIWCI